MLLEKEEEEEVQVGAASACTQTVEVSHEGQLLQALQEVAVKVRVEACEVADL